MPGREEQPSVDAAAILAWRRAPRLQIVSRARLPLAGAENTEIVDIVRGMSIPLAELPLLFEKLKGGGALGQSVPKSDDEEKEEN